MGRLTLQPGLTVRPERHWKKPRRGRAGPKGSQKAMDSVGTEGVETPQPIERHPVLAQQIDKMGRSAATLGKCVVKLRAAGKLRPCSRPAEERVDGRPYCAEHAEIRRLAARR